MSDRQAEETRSGGDELPGAGADPAPIALADAFPALDESSPSSPGTPPDLAGLAAEDVTEVMPEDIVGTAEKPLPAGGAGTGIAPAPPPQAAAPHRVVVHTTDGLVRRAVVGHVALGEPEIELAAEDGGAVERIPSRRVKAVFFMLAQGEPAPAAEGRRLRVVFHDGRQLAGVSADYEPGAPSFSLVPEDARTRAARIWIPLAAVRQVSLS